MTASSARPQHARGRTGQVVQDRAAQGHQDAAYAPAHVHRQQVDGRTYRPLTATASRDHSHRPAVSTVAHSAINPLPMGASILSNGFSLGSLNPDPVRTFVAPAPRNTKSLVCIQKARPSRPASHALNGLPWGMMTCVMTRQVDDGGSSIPSGTSTGTREEGSINSRTDSGGAATSASDDYRITATPRTPQSRPKSRPTTPGRSPRRGRTNTPGGERSARERSRR